MINKIILILEPEKLRLVLYEQQKIKNLLMKLWVLAITVNLLTKHLNYKFYYPHM